MEAIIESTYGMLIKVPDIYDVATVRASMVNACVLLNDKEYLKEHNPLNKVGNQPTMLTRANGVLLRNRLQKALDLIQANSSIEPRLEKYSMIEGDAAIANDIVLTVVLTLRHLVREVMPAPIFIYCTLSLTKPLGECVMEMAPSPNTIPLWVTITCGDA